MHENWFGADNASADVVEDLSIAARVQRLQPAKRFFESQQTKPAFWAAAVPDAAGDSVNADAFRAEIANLRRYWRLDGPRKPIPTNECQEIIDRAPERKFAGLLSYPTLSKFFRFIVDVEVDPEDIRSLLGPGTMATQTAHSPPTSVSASGSRRTSVPQ